MILNKNTRDTIHGLLSHDPRPNKIASQLRLPTRAVNDVLRHILERSLFQWAKDPRKPPQDALEPWARAHMPPDLPTASVALYEEIDTIRRAARRLLHASSYFVTEQDAKWVARALDIRPSIFRRQIEHARLLDLRRPRHTWDSDLMYWYHHSFETLNPDPRHPPLFSTITQAEQWLSHTPH